jgi:hypothetical protein
MQKRGQIAVFLVVLFIAAIGIAAVLSGPGTTGLSFWGPRQSNLPGVCGSVCYHDKDCSGECSSCSPSLGRCISLKKNATVQITDRYSWRNIVRCQNNCNDAYKWCMMGVKSDADVKKCAANKPLCIKQCSIFHIPGGKTA